MTARYYADADLPTIGSGILLPVEESHHLTRVMRLRPGAEVRVFSRGREAAGVFQGTEGKQALIVLSGFLSTPPAPRIAIHCAVPWIKGGRTELVLQKATELGVAGVIVFHARREVVRPSGDKLDRLRRVVLEACKQSGRADVPGVSEATDLASAISQAAVGPSSSFVLYENERHITLGQAVARLDLQNSSPAVLLASGPEGGFDPQEVEAVRHSATMVSLGPRILRAETAPVAAVSAVLALAGEF